MGSVVGGLDGVTVGVSEDVTVGASVSITAGVPVVSIGGSVCEGAGNYFGVKIVRLTFLSQM